MAASPPPLAGPDARSRPGRWADLALRTGSALVLLPVALLCVWHGGWPWSLLAGLAAIVLVAEFVAMCRAGRPSPSVAAIGLGYICLGAACVVLLRADPIMGRSNLLFLLACVWASDIGAYLVGRSVGGPRLAAAISPGKTRSGAVGGLLAAMAAGAGVGLTLPHGAIAAAAVLGGLLGIAAQAGDLLESWLKRACRVKDSGRLIPGHGGLLDRVDGVLLAAPAMALLALWLGRGVVLWS